ncbi:MAG: 16S rRNA (cytidine(1402)-2'-O)-methyltransferase [Halanaerobiales bacterium]
MTEKRSDYVQAGKLYIVGTPIGNLEDITYRALKVLKGVDLIAAEDTRRTIKLLNYYEIKKQLESYHEHNEKEKAERLISLLKSGKSIAVVSDAGMPGVSDPGLELVKLAIDENIEIIPVPGPTAAINALVVSGMDTASFVFEGFLNRKGREREEQLERLKGEKRTIIIYESPYRLKETLRDLADIMGNRKIAIVREISKLHEEKIYGNTDNILAKMDGREIKGEIVLVIEGNQKINIEKEGWEDMDLLEHVKLFIDQGMSKKKAIKRVAEVRDVPKRDVYKAAIAIDVDK